MTELNSLPAAGAQAHSALVRQVASSSAPGRSVIAASWHRSLLHLRLDPQSSQRRSRIEASALRERREKVALLLRAAEPAINRLASVALDCGNAVVLADPEGMILQGLCRSADDGHFDLLGLAPGSDWSEASEGTNAIGTALVDGRPVVVGRDQHFFARNLSLSCIGAPIEAADGSLGAVLNVSSCRDDMTDVQARLIALSVQDAAHQIGAALFHAAHAGARVVTLGTDPGQGASLVAVDADDLVIGANRAARRRLGLSVADLAAHPPLGDILEPLGAAGGAARSDLDRAMRSEIARALTRAKGNVSRAARELGIGRATLYRKMATLGLDHRG